MSALPPKADIRRRTLGCPLSANSRHPGRWGSSKAHGFKNRSRERIFAVGQPKREIEMARAGHCDETGGAATRHGCTHICFALTFKFISLARRVRDDEWYGALRHVQQRREFGDIGFTEVQPFIGMAKSYGF